MMIFSFSDFNSSFSSYTFLLSNTIELGIVLTIKNIVPLHLTSSLKTKLILLFEKKNEAKKGLIENIVIKYNQEAINFINSIQNK